MGWDKKFLNNYTNSRCYDFELPRPVYVRHTHLPHFAIHALAFATGHMEPTQSWNDMLFQFVSHSRTAYMSSYL